VLVSMLVDSCRVECAAESVHVQLILTWPVRLQLQCELRSGYLRSTASSLTVSPGIALFVC
jgi:hypothetical protein